MKIKGVAAEANKIHAILRQVGITPPVDVREVALELSRLRFPNSPITHIIGEDLPGLEGALIAKRNKKEWVIVYNNNVLSTGRINFTLAHEFGHYLLHRENTDRFECGDKDMLAWDSDYGRMEAEANKFASYLLMPIDDFRNQLNGKINLETFKHCAERYQVSLTAAIIKWLEFTEQKSILVVSREGYMLWAWSSEPAFKNYLYFKTSGTPIPIPPDSFAARGIESLNGEMMSKNVWWPDREVREMTIRSDYHDMIISLLTFD